MTKIKNSIIYSAYCFFLLTGCAFANSSDSLSIWANSHLSNSEKIICQKNIDGDYYLVAIKDERIKTGYFIDVTGDNNTPKTYEIGWVFQDENDRYLETNSPPKDIKHGYVEKDKKMFSENISHRKLQLKDANRLIITVEIKKYKSGGSKIDFNKIPLCDVN